MLLIFNNTSYFSFSLTILHLHWSKLFNFVSLLQWPSIWPMYALPSSSFPKLLLALHDDLAQVGATFPGRSCLSAPRSPLSRIRWLFFVSPQWPLHMTIVTLIFKLCLSFLCIHSWQDHFVPLWFLRTSHIWNKIDASVPFLLDVLDKNPTI